MTFIYTNEYLFDNTIFDGNNQWILYNTPAMHFYCDKLFQHLIMMTLLNLQTDSDSCRNYPRLLRYCYCSHPRPRHRQTDPAPFCTPVW